jgi:hypothetical protein
MKKTSKKIIKKTATTLYCEGNRTPKVVKEWNEKCRIVMYNRCQDPYCATKPLICYRNAVKRATEYGNFVSTDLEDIRDQMHTYQTSHQWNIRDGKGTWSVDHIIELKDGGSQTASNLQIIHCSENSKKSHRARIARKNIKK